MMCNADMMFVDVIIKWSGIGHDARIPCESAVFFAFMMMMMIEDDNDDDDHVVL